ncbi:MAG: DUF2273 domain-containing protein [bacterium]
MRFLELIKGWIEKNPNAFLGGLIGLFFGLLIISFGPLKTIILLLSCLIGFLIGKRL